MNWVCGSGAVTIVTSVSGLTARAGLAQQMATSVLKESSHGPVPGVFLLLMKTSGSVGVDLRQYRAWKILGCSGKRIECHPALAVGAMGRRTQYRARRWPGSVALARPSPT